MSVFENYNKTLVERYISLKKKKTANMLCCRAHLPSMSPLRLVTFSIFVRTTQLKTNNELTPLSTVCVALA